MSTISTTRELDRPRRLLLLANEALADETIGVVVARHAAGRTEVLVVAPALGSRLELWMSDDRPRRAAEERLERCLAKLAVAGIEAEGLVGDADPLLAVDDALRLFPADEIVVATGSPARSSWLARARTARPAPLPAAGPPRHRGVCPGGGDGGIEVARRCATLTADSQPAHRAAPEQRGAMG